MLLNCKLNWPIAMEIKGGAQWALVTLSGLLQLGQWFQRGVMVMSDCHQNLHLLPDIWQTKNPKTFKMLKSWGNCGHPELPGEKWISARLFVPTTTTSCRKRPNPDWQLAFFQIDWEKEKAATMSHKKEKKKKEKAATMSHKKEKNEKEEEEEKKRRRQLCPTLLSSTMWFQEFVTSFYRVVFLTAPPPP